MNLSTEDLAVLAHVLPDPNTWVTNAFASLGQEAGEAAVLAKITKYRQDYLDALAAQGANYETRAQRDAALKATADAEAATAAGVRDALRQQLLTLAQSAVGVSLDQLTAQQRNSLTAAMLYLLGGVTQDMTVKPLGEWLK